MCGQRVWKSHKVHHSIVEMDWIGDWRFHWFEILVYNVLLSGKVMVLATISAVGKHQAVLNL